LSLGMVSLSPFEPTGEVTHLGDLEATDLQLPHPPAFQDPANPKSAACIPQISIWKPSQQAQKGSFMEKFISHPAVNYLTGQERGSAVHLVEEWLFEGLPPKWESPAVLPEGASSYLPKPGEFWTGNFGCPPRPRPSLHNCHHVVGPFPCPLLSPLYL
jgi:hypothetical protein